MGKCLASFAASRLSALGHHIGPFEPFVYMSRNAAGQIIHRHRNNAALAWTGHYDVVRDYASNGLNQYTQSGPVTPTYDARGNLTSAGAGNYHYTVDNQLAHAPGGNFVYDPLGRLFHGTSDITDFRYDGTALISEHQGHGGPLRRRYVHGSGTDDPIVWYEGTDLSDKRWLHADERGSIVAITNASSQVIALNSYDEYGIPGTGNIGRFQYTGQTWLPELGMYYYKARIYSPYLGRFLQPDPIGYGDGLNMYAYVKNDPINFVDPTGLMSRAECEKLKTPGSIVSCGEKKEEEVVVFFVETGDDGGGIGSSGGTIIVIGRKAQQKKLSPPRLGPRSKPYVCSKLGSSGYNVRKAWAKANLDRHTKSNGRNNWNNPIYREGENWLTAASDYYTVPFARTPQIYLHQYRKMLPFSGSTPFSQEALDAGLDGQSHNGDTPEQLKAWCNAN